MYSYIPSGVCSKRISFEIVDDVVKNITFDGGCNGNGKGIAALADGQKVDDLITKLSCIECKERGTSCPAQLAKALQEAKFENESKSR